MKAFNLNNIRHAGTLACWCLRIVLRPILKLGPDFLGARPLLSEPGAGMNFLEKPLACLKN
jgi:hypothetical protein